MNILFVIPCLCYLYIATSSSCFWNTRCLYKYFASKSLYSMIRGDIRDSVMKLPDCEPISIWMIMRHGKRNPSTHFIKEMQDTLTIRDDIISSYERGNSSLCAQDVDNLRAWVVDNEVFNKINQLSDEGYQEMILMGQRIKQAFPKLLAQLSKGEYTFRSLKEKRIQISIEGLVEGLGNKNLYIEPSKDGYDVIAPFELCKKYINNVIRNSATFSEIRRYQQSSEYLETKYRIQRRLGIDYSLTNGNVMAFWNFCRSNSSGIFNTFSPWCALLTTEDLEVMEYIEDLKHFYRNGYGVYEMSKAFGQIVLSDLLINFRNATTTGKKITAYVTDSTVMDMIVTALGLFKDANPITGKERIPERKWRTREISSFCSNIIAVLNRCNKPEDSSLNVTFYYNEEPLRTICNDGVCSWKEFEDKFSPFLDTNTNFC